MGKRVKRLQRVQRWSTIRPEIDPVEMLQEPWSHFYVVKRLLEEIKQKSVWFRRAPEGVKPIRSTTDPLEIGFPTVSLSNGCWTDKMEAAGPGAPPCRGNCIERIPSNLGAKGKPEDHQGDPRSRAPRARESVPWSSQIKGIQDLELPNQGNPYPGAPDQGNPCPGAARSRKSLANPCSGLSNGRSTLSNGCLILSNGR